MMKSMKQSGRLARGLRTAMTVATVAAMLVACGGGGAKGQGGSDSVKDASTAATVMLGADSISIGSSGAKSVVLVATVKSATNVAMTGQKVSFSTTDSGATLSVGQATTDAAGTAVATLALNDPTLRAIPIRASTGSVSSDLTINVVGTALTISGSGSIGFGSASNYVVAVTNSDGTAMAGAPVTLASALGNTVSPTTAVANSSGQASFSVTGTRAGSDTLTANSLGASAATAVSVSGNVVAVTSPTAAQEVLVNTAQAVSVRFLVDGAPLVGAEVQLNATRGTLGAYSALTDATGTVSTTIQSATAGQSTITATGPAGIVGTGVFEFVSRVPAAVTLQASPTTIGVNVGSSSTNSSTLLARVRDASGNPVKGVRVDFTAIADPSNGQISPAFATTNSSGIASTAFIGGPNSSGFNKVQVRATVSGVSLPADANLTVAAQALMVRIHTGNLLFTPDALSYSMPFSAVVTDTAGNPIEGATVTPSYVPTFYHKGTYVLVGDKWVPSFAQSCASEDANGDGILNVGEDLNGNGELDPGNVASVFPANDDWTLPLTSAKTDASGFTRIALKYPRGYANWAGVNIMFTVTATAGTETVVNTRVDHLPALSEDLAKASPPGGSTSKFGIAPGCDNTN